MLDTTQFKSRLVQDLAWVIASPPLVSGEYKGVHWWNEEECLKEFSDCLPALKILDENPEPLITHIAKLKSGRLGLRFESYISYWLKISPNYSLLAKNIQVIKEGHTYGELDFIIQNIHTKTVIHLEVAVKFYLGADTNNSSLENPFHWFGTNTQDQLGLKLKHLREHQTQLYETYKDHIQKLLKIEINDKHCFLKGRLFYPMDNNTPPNDVTNNHLRGHWTYEKEFEKPPYFQPIEKRDWLAPLNPENLKVLIKQQPQPKNKHISCYVHATQNNLGEYLEKDRVFILPNDFWDFLQTKHS